MGEVIGFIWNQVLIDPATNFMVVLTRILFGSYGLAIIAFTIILRFVTLPLMLKQIQSSKNMQVLQPRIQEIQKKYSDPKRRNEETMKLYKEAGVNPVGCLGPMLIQFPILIGLYQVIRTTLATTPESLIDLSHRLYPWAFIQQGVPLTSHFLWLNLAAADKTYILPVLVAATMWLQQKLTMTQQTMAAGSQSAQTNQMMLWFMPLLFGYFSLSFPSGLSLYYVLTNVIGIAINYYVFGWHKKPLREAFGGSGFSLSALFAPPKKDGARGRAVQRGNSGGRPAPQRAVRQNQKQEPAARANGRANEPVVTDTNGTSANGTSFRDVDARRRQRREARNARDAGRGQPKAPPVSRPAPRATGRLSEDAASADGGADTSPSNGTMPGTE